jgi:hypothetical protein
MKVLFYLTGHRQLEEYKLQSYFFNNFKYIEDFDVIVYCNSNHELETLQEYCDGIPNLTILHNQRNSGYKTGLFTAVADHYDKFSKYDIVVHMHPDVFITDDSEFYRNLKIMMWLGFDFMSAPTLHNMKYDVDGLGWGSDEGWFDGVSHRPKENCYYSADLFAFKPDRVDVNFFDADFDGETEHILYYNILKYNLRVHSFQRHSRILPELFFTMDSSKIWHSHNLQEVRDFFKIEN